MRVQVRGCPGCGAVLAQGASFCHACGAATPTGAYAASPNRSETRERLAASLGPDYVLGDMLGTGGFAEVFLAWDAKLKREVAVKTLRAELTGSHDIGERFRREAEAIAQLRHPHIVPIYSVADAGSLAWFVMPRIDGVTLAAAIASETHWSFADACRILRESAAALGAAHARGIVHRDVKPENIMLEGPERRVVVMDFGIAKSLDTTTNAALTGTGLMVGTPQYMSPEQASGDPVGPASDQYSLGLIGYRLLTGRMPFETDSVRSLMAMQAGAAPPPVRTLRADVPPALARVIERALEKDPAARYESMSVMVEALDRVARDVAGEYRRGRRAVPMVERWSEARRRTSGIKRLSLAAIAVAGLVVGFAMPRVFSAGVHRTLAMRDDALLAARGQLAVEGFRTAPMRFARFGRDRGLNDFLNREFPPRVADGLAGVYDVWTWEYDFELPGETRWMYFGTDARPVRDIRVLPDSLRVGQVSSAEARRLADSVLRARGLSPDTLEFQRIATTVFPEYAMHRVIWQLRGTRIARAADTAAVLVQVTISGRSPSAFVRLGQVWGKTTSPEPVTARTILSIGYPVVMLAIGVMTIVALLRRLGTDVLQWRMALVTGAVVVAIWAPVRLGSTAGAQDIQSFAYQVTRQIPIQLSTWILAASCLVAAESLWYETKPELTAGLDDLARGRFTVPELIPATLAGYSWGLSLAAAALLVHAASRVIFDRPYLALPVYLDAFETRFAWLAPLLPMAFGIAACAVVLFFGGLLQSRRGSLPMLCACAGITMLAPFALAFDVFTAVVLSALIALIPICIIRYGYVAAVLAVGTAFGVPMVLDFLWAGGPYLAPGLIGLALLVLPAIWAIRLSGKSVRAGERDV